MKRIRYVKLENGTSVSPELLAGKTLVRVNLLPENRFSIVDSENGITLMEGIGKARHDVLKKVKVQLITMGVVFEDEVRNVVELENTEGTTSTGVTLNA